MLYMQQIHTQRTKQRKDMKSIIHWPTNKWQTKDITLLTKNVKSVKRNNDYCPKWWVTAQALYKWEKSESGMRKWEETWF